MATFPTFQFPGTNTQANPAFAPPRVDFSRIGEMYGNYVDAQNARLKQDAFQEDRANQRDERARQSEMRQAFSGGIPRDQQGNIDFSAIADRWVQIGEPEKALSFLSQQQPKLTENQKLYAQARDQGFKGTLMEFLEAKAGFSRPQTNINMPKMESEYDKKLGGMLAEEFVNANKAATTAQRDLSNLNVMRQALSDPNLYTGTGGNFIQGIKKGAETLFGVPVKGTSSGEVMQNLASEIAVANKDKLPGPMSDADRQFLIDMAPNLSKTPEGNRLIIELGMAHKKWEVERAKAARDYAARNNGRLDGNFYAAVGELDSQAEQQFATFIAQMRGLGEMAPRSPAAGVPNYYKDKYGLE